MTTTTGNEGLLADAIYDRLRAEIVYGRLRPNQRLVETDLAQTLNASRTPIRESLQRLELAGLVLRDKRGWIVHEHTRDEIRTIYEVRGALEGYAAFLAAERATSSELAHLERLCPADDAARELSPDVHVELNERFHDGVIAAARNTRLARLCRDSRQFYFNFRIARLYNDDDTSRAIEGHRRILSALVARDAAEAEARSREHVNDALEIVWRKLT